MRAFFTILLFLPVFSSFAQSKKELARLTQTLESVYRNDQEPRLKLDSLSTQFGYGSDRVRQQWQLIAKNDSINTIIVTHIIDKYGWLSEKQTSKNANAALFFVIQHAELLVQIKYLPMLKKAVQQRKAKPSYYAYLLDRTNMKQGKLQIYGSQLTMAGNGSGYFFPIADEPNVNTRRNMIGLRPLEEYAQQIGIFYSAPKEDSLKDKFVLVGFVLERDQKPIEDVFVFAGNKLITKTNSKGIYKAIIDKEIKEYTISFKKEGYAISEIPINGKGKEVAELFVMLTKE